ncbi:Eukaryotic porin [Parasponia andersonii]|uniref:Eukaryotic porin n=1 Tax=Parasponia andersonii TaxID=3476 RepID=A0A2P5DNE9_PARAD|nr:Eukaryotic porin [Parasponia andersonii]
MNKTRRKTPLFFYQFGKKSRDFFGKGYCGHSKTFMVSTTSTANGLTLTSAATKRFIDSIEAVRAEYKYKNHHTAVQIDTVRFPICSAYYSYELKYLPYAKAKASFRYPNWSSSKFQLWSRPHRNAMLHLHADLSKSHPKIRLSASIGTPSMAFGFQGMLGRNYGIAYTAWSGGIQVTRPYFDVTITIRDCLKQDTCPFSTRGVFLRASYIQYLDEAKKIAAGLEITRWSARKEHTIRAGGSWAIGDLTSVKAKIDHLGNVTTLLQYNIQDKSLFKISAGFNIKALDKDPIIGFFLVLKP